jgi:hypothetical protein
MMLSCRGTGAVIYETHSGGHELGGKEKQVCQFLGKIAGK